MLHEMILYYASIFIVFVICTFETKGEIPKPTRSEIVMLNSNEWCKNEYYEVILQSLKQTSQFCDKRTDNHNFPQKLRFSLKIAIFFENHDFYGKSRFSAKIAIFGNFLSPSGLIAASSREKKVVNVLRG